MLHIFQKMKKKAEQEDSFTWEMTQNTKKNHKRSNFDYQQGSKTHHIFSSGSRDWRRFHRCKRRSRPSNNTRRIGAQPAPTPIETDNTTATGYINGTIKQKRTKAMDMRFYWIKDTVKQGQFNVYWGPSFQILADYFTKHHSPAYQKRMR
jgi:hypothetical protein